MKALVVLAMECEAASPGDFARACMAARDAMKGALPGLSTVRVARAKRVDELPPEKVVEEHPAGDKIRFTVRHAIQLVQRPACRHCGGPVPAPPTWCFCKAKRPRGKCEPFRENKEIER